MTEKEVAELRRRYKPDKNNISHVHGCYVNEKGEILSLFHQSLTVISLEEYEKIMALLRRALSGSLGKNLLDITFETRQVVDGAEHKRLMELRRTKLEDDTLLEEFFRSAIESLHMEGSYLILMAHDAYDVPYRSKDGEDQADAAEEVYTSILCAVCPVKATKPALSYSAYDNAFRNLTADTVIAPPVAGFLFPAFDDRSTNLYNALYYTKNPVELQEDFLDTVFHASRPMPAPVQQETFQSVLQDALDDACSYEVVQAVNDTLRDLIVEHKLNKEEGNLTLSRTAMEQVLQASGVEEAGIRKFDTGYNEAFGANTELRPQNLVDPKRMEIKTTDVTIRVNPLKSELVETRLIDGVPYILIQADDTVEVDGVPIQIQ